MRKYRLNINTNNRIAKKILKYFDFCLCGKMITISKKFISSCENHSFIVRAKLWKHILYGLLWNMFPPRGDDILKLSNVLRCYLH